MLNNISWSSFIWLLFPALIAYYLYVVVAFYRKEILSLGTLNKKSVDKNILNNVPSSKKPNVPDKPPVVSEISGEDSFTFVHELLEDLKELFFRASRKKMVKEELIQAIGSKLKTYPSLRETELVEDINTHLILESKEKCQVDLLPEDLKQIWKV
jgi:hypothetical protein